MRQSCKEKRENAQEEGQELGVRGSLSLPRSINLCNSPAFSIDENKQENWLFHAGVILHCACYGSKSYLQDKEEVESPVLVL